MYYLIQRKVSFFVLRKMLMHIDTYLDASPNYNVNVILEP